MSWVGGLLLFVGAGIAVASLTVVSGLAPELPVATRNVEASPVALAPTAMRGIRDTEAVPTPSAADGPAPTPVVVTLPKRPSEPVGVMSPKAGTIPDRASLAQELQRELRRVGCYEAEINGSWTPATRRAMKAFTDRVNATLPVEKPDYILLTLVQAQQDRVCGAPCPTGEGQNSEGRCLPNAVLARIKRGGAPAVVLVPSSTDGPKPTITGWSTSVTTAVDPVATVPEGRMALAGPQTGPEPVASEVRKPPAQPRRAQQRQASRRLDVGAFFRRLDGVP